MPTRALTALTAAVILATTVTATPAYAEADCSIVDFTPQTITMGLAHTKAVTFDVGTDCDDEEFVSWRLGFNNPADETSGSYPLLANFEQLPDSQYTYIPNGDYTWQRGDNTEPGAREVFIDAFIGDDDEDENNTFSGMADFTILKRTSFGSTFNASPEPRRKGQTIKINATLREANWDTDTYDGVGAWVLLQFRPEGEDDFQDVKWVWHNGVDAKTTVKATRTGTWRYHYEGTDTLAPSNSKGDTVIVKPARRRTAKEYANCTELRKVYPHGVGRAGAHDKTSGTPVTTWTVDDEVYNLNAKSDRDGDKIACEKR